jgi:benzoyl-CoA reductase/2-hydroxyglutaryl-CoA dehydratase subunit BcrC/BadD/HgdB
MPVLDAKLFQYPKEIEKDFIKTPGITFRDGSHATSEEIWKFMTEEAPRRFPHSFDVSASHIGRISDDVRFFSGIKRGYLTLTLKDRLLKAHAQGVPTVLIQGGQTMDAYYAAGAIPLRPGLIMGWAREMNEGLNLRQNDLAGVEILEAGRSTISMEACNQIAAHAAIAKNIVPIDLIAPYLCLRCSDMAYLVESHRDKAHKKPLQVVDYPIESQGKPWATDLVASELRRLTRKIDTLTGRSTTDQQIFDEVRLENRGRRIAREILELWWSAETPPTNGTDFFGIPFVANDFLGDPVAAIQVLEQTLEEVRWRVQNKVKGTGVVDNPRRVFICGSCVGPNSHHVEHSGAVLVGRDDNFSSISVDVEESGDPYLAMAKAILSFPYELPTERRADWTIEMLKKSKAHGVVFMYNWGCNFQTGIARMMMDIVKEKTGLPATFIEVGELGRSEATEQSENRIEAFIEML